LSRLSIRDQDPGYLGPGYVDSGKSEKTPARDVEHVDFRTRASTE
jgi:hypothetical protein